MSDLQYLVVPGQVIATSSADSKGDDSFLRGHGTYLEISPDGQQQRLIASVTGVVQRVNKLISVQSTSASVYQGQVGDLVVGRITAVGPTRWKVQLNAQDRTAVLPLSGVHLPGGVQRIRTSEDARDMRNYLAEGDLVSAEVHKVQADGALMLHTRSFRYGKLENGCWITVPPALIARRKSHYTTILDDKFQVLWGCNGGIWMQRAMPDDRTESSAGPELAQLEEERRRQHANEPYQIEERRNLARLRNAVECLRLVHCQITPQAVEQVYRDSLALAPAEMLRSDHVLLLTEASRKINS